MSDTPETDGLEFKAQPGMMPPFNTVPSEFARRLERERNRAVEQRRCECSFDEACRFAAERDALREENRKLREMLERYVERDAAGDEIRKLRDALQW